MSKNNPFNKNKWEICYHLINSVLFGMGSFFGAMIQAFTASDINLKSLGVAFMVGLITTISVALYKFKEYWDGEASEYSCKLFKIV